MENKKYPNMGGVWINQPKEKGGNKTLTVSVNPEELAKMDVDKYGCVRLFAVPNEYDKGKGPHYRFYIKRDEPKKKQSSGIDVSDI